MRSDRPSAAIFAHREVVLRRGDRGGGDAAAVTLRGVDGESAPAGADLEHVIGGLEVELAADGFELGCRAFVRAWRRRAERCAQEYAMVSSSMSW